MLPTRRAATRTQSCALPKRSRGREVAACGDCALGVRENVEVDYRLMHVNEGDIFILCSDGLCGYAEDEEIFRAADRHRTDLDAMADELIRLAYDRGGPDNITVAIVEVALSRNRYSRPRTGGLKKWPERAPTNRPIKKKLTPPPRPPQTRD